VHNGTLETFPKLEMVLDYGVCGEVIRVIQAESKKLQELKDAIMPYVRSYSSLG
jgi:hypothetical protein